MVLFICKRGESRERLKRGKKGKKEWMGGERKEWM